MATINQLWRWVTLEIVLGFLTGHTYRNLYERIFQVSVRTNCLLLQGFYIALLFVWPVHWSKKLDFSLMFLWSILIQIGYKNQQRLSEIPPLTKEKAVTLVKDVFISAAERDIYTGDAVVIHLITKDEIREDSFPLRRD